jgi:hypothetical protein
MAISGEPPGCGEKCAVYLAISSDPGPEAQREKAQGTMVSASPIGDDISERSSLTAEADGISSSSDRVTKGLSSHSDQAASPVTSPSSISRPTFCSRLKPLLGWPERWQAPRLR